MHSALCLELGAKTQINEDMVANLEGLLVREKSLTCFGSPLRATLEAKCLR